MEMGWNKQQPLLLRARAAIEGAGHVLVITGAGISADSGVPTFRSAGGYWRDRRLSELASPATFAREPALVWEWYLERRRTVAACEPNLAHRALSAFAERCTLATQNVDGLHERAGHPAVIRLHGSLWKNRCSRCGSERDDASVSHAALPLSPCCSALERPAIVWFGEALPASAVALAQEALARSDVVVVIGTSGTVWPAAKLVHDAYAQGAKVIEINREPTELPATIRLNAIASLAVPALLRPETELTN
jgi:NAD-dependent deacetylase